MLSLGAKNQGKACDLEMETSVSCILSKSWGILGSWIGKRRWIFLALNLEVAIALCVLGTIGRLVKTRASKC